MGYHEDCPECGGQLPDTVSTSDGPCTDCLTKRIEDLEEDVLTLAHDYAKAEKVVMVAKKLNPQFAYVVGETEYISKETACLLIDLRTALADYDTPAEKETPA